MWLPMPNAFSETQLHALKLCLQWSDSCLKSVSDSGENHFLVLNGTWGRKPWPCSTSPMINAGWLRHSVFYTECFSRKPNAHFIHFLITTAFCITEKYGLPLVLYSWCFGIFLISLLQLIFVCLLLSTSCDICGRGVLDTFYPSCNVDPFRPNLNVLQTTVAFKLWSKTSLYYLFWLVLIWNRDLMGTSVRQCYSFFSFL